MDQLDCVVCICDFLFKKYSTLPFYILWGQIFYLYPMGQWAVCWGTVDVLLVQLSTVCIM